MTLHTEDYKGDDTLWDDVAVYTRCRGCLRLCAPTCPDRRRWTLLGDIHLGAQHISPGLEFVLRTMVVASRTVLRVLVYDFGAHW